MKAYLIFQKTILSKASKLVREAGGVVILDEVQAGFGRTGTWWGYELSGLVPDICVMENLWEQEFQ